MSKYAFLLAVCLLATVFALAQASQPAPSPAPGPSQSTSQQNPQRPPAPGPASDSDRSAASGDTGQSNPAATSNQPTQQPSTPRERGGIGWGWIIVAIIVGVIIIGMLSRGRADRIERVDRVERDHDDIRRAG